MDGAKTGRCSASVRILFGSRVRLVRGPTIGKAGDAPDIRLALDTEHRVAPVRRATRSTQLSGARTQLPDQQSYLMPVAVLVTRIAYSRCDLTHLAAGSGSWADRTVCERPAGRCRYGAKPLASEVSRCFWSVAVRSRRGRD